MNKKIIIIILAIILVSYFSITFFIPVYLLHGYSDKLGFILYNCAFGFDRSGSLGLLNFDNGTHIINETSCKWIKK